MDYALWICPSCHGEYPYRINERHLNDDACPYCNKGRPLAGYNTLDITDPELAKEWSKANNRAVDTVTKELRVTVLWTCPDCHGDYPYMIAERQVGDDSCPYCNKNRPLAGVNTLDVTNPELAKEWSVLNIRAIDTVTKDMRTIVKWTCPVCHKDYRFPIADRHVGDESCPHCNKIKALKGFSFADKHPDLLEEWDYISNYLLYVNPDEILDNCSKTVWWKCKDCGRRYQLTPKKKLLYQKRHMKSCLYCKGYRRNLRHFI